MMLILMDPLNPAFDDVWGVVEEDVEQASLERGSADADTPNALQQNALDLLEEGEMDGDDEGVTVRAVRVFF